MPHAHHNITYQTQQRVDNSIVRNARTTTECVISQIDQQVDVCYTRSVYAFDCDLACYTHRWILNYSAQRRFCCLTNTKCKGVIESKRVRDRRAHNKLFVFVYVVTSRSPRYTKRLKHQHQQP